MYHEEIFVLFCWYTSRTKAGWISSESWYYDEDRYWDFTARHWITAACPVCKIPEGVSQRHSNRTKWGDLLEHRAQFPVKPHTPCGQSHFSIGFRWASKLPAWGRLFQMQFALACKPQEWTCLLVEGLLEPFDERGCEVPGLRVSITMRYMERTDRKSMAKYGEKCVNWIRC